MISRKTLKICFSILLSIMFCSACICGTLFASAEEKCPSVKGDEIIIDDDSDSQPQIPDEYKGCGTSLCIKKIDSTTSAPLAGATFKIRSDSFGFGAKTITTDKNGYACISGLSAGFYYIKETSAPKGYIPLQEEIKYKVHKNQPNILEIKNTKYGAITIKKVDDCGAAVKDAVFNVYEGKTTSTDKLIKKDVKTDENGKLQITDLMPNKDYTVQEVKAPDGYHIDTTPQHVYIKPGDIAVLTFINKRVKPGTMKIYKLDCATNQTLPGAKIEIYNDKSCSDNSKVDSFVSGTDTHVLNNLKPGTYYVKEIQAPKGYQLYKKTIEVTIKENQTTVVKLYNHMPPVTAGNFGLLLLVGLGLTIITGGALLLFYRRKKI